MSEPTINPDDYDRLADKLREAEARAQRVEADARRWQQVRADKETTLIIAYFGNGCMNKRIEDVEAVIDAALRPVEPREGR